MTIWELLFAFFICGLPFVGILYCWYKLWGSMLDKHDEDMRQLGNRDD